ncbi:MAG: hypothetical protein ACREP3_07025, partial [Candidatus Binatia bacterium]
MKSAQPVLVAAIAALAFSFGASAAKAQRVLSPEHAAKVVSIKNLKATPSEVSGVIVNNTPHTIREIEVLVEYHWLWANEFKPGAESPGHVATVKLDKELSPGESTAFRHVPNPPLPNRQDGRF